MDFSRSATSGDTRRHPATTRQGSSTLMGFRWSEVQILSARPDRKFPSGRPSGGEFLTTWLLRSGGQTRVITYACDSIARGCHVLADPNPRSSMRPSGRSTIVLALAHLRIASASQMAPEWVTLTTDRAAQPQPRRHRQRQPDCRTTLLHPQLVCRHMLAIDRPRLHPLIHGSWRRAKSAAMRDWRELVPPLHRLIRDPRR